MKKVLCGLLLGITLATLPLKGIGQEPEKKNYEYNIYWGNLDVGDAKGNSDKINFNINFFKVRNLTFIKKGNDYFESLKSEKDEEKYFYVRSDSLRLDDYIPYFNGEEKRSEGRKDKREGIGKNYSKQVIFGTEIFDVFGGDSIPSKLETLVFGDLYSFKLDEIFGVKKTKGGLIKVRYNIPINPQTKTDRFRINEPIEVYLKKEESNYHIVGGRINFEGKFIFWIPFNVNVLEKGYEKD